MQSRAPADGVAPESSLPLLVRMPDGERHQVDVAATASVRQLKDSLTPLLDTWAGAPSTPGPSADWELDFGGSILKDTATLGDYHIPDAYDHASGLLRTISNSAHANAGKKVEALDKACTVVAGISKGELDMEALIASVIDEDDNPAPPDDTAQPRIGTLKRKGRSRIPSLNFSHLPPPMPLDSAAKPSPRAPPTPSQLIRRLSSTRPDLYSPAVVARADTGDPGALSGEIKKRASWFTEAVAMGAPDSGGSGVLKKENTWFREVISAFGNSVGASKVDSPDVDHDFNDDVGGSEGELEREDRQSPRQQFTGKTDRDAPRSTQEPNKPSNADRAKEEEAAKLDAPTSNSKPASAHPAKSTNGATAKDSSAKTDSNKIDSTASGAIGAAVAAAAAAAGATNITLPKGGSVAGSETIKPSSSSLGSKSSSPGGPHVEPQVIGLNPEHPHVEDDGKLPKKRGRKRKNPHLTEEQRKLQRQAQNRESAKLSRIRRKNMTAEYEKRVTTLEGENENLRDTVAALTDRLEILQNLLTISVQRRPVPAGPLGQPILPPQAPPHVSMPMGAPAAPLPASLVPQAPMASHPQIANFNYKNF